MSYSIDLAAVVGGSIPYRRDPESSCCPGAWGELKAVEEKLEEKAPEKAEEKISVEESVVAEKPAVEESAPRRQL